MNQTVIYDAAEALRVVAYGTWPIGDPDRPEESYVEHVGTPNIGPQLASGCSRLVVWNGPLSLAEGDGPAVPAGARKRVQPSRPVLTFTVSLRRCGAPMADLTAQGKAIIPTPAAIAAFGQTMAVDLARLWTTLHTHWRAGTLFGPTTPPPIAADSVQIGGATPTGPESGIAGWDVPITVTF